MNEEKIKEIFYKNDIEYTSKRSYSVYLGHAHRFGFKEKDELQNLDHYFKWSNNNEKLKIDLCKKYNKKYSIKQWNNYLMLAKRNNIESENDLELVKNYFNLCETNIKNHIIIMKKYNINYINEYSWSNFIRNIEKAGFNENTIDEYYKYKEKQYKEIKEDNKKLLKEKRNHIDLKQKKLFQKYDKTYLGVKSFHNTLVIARKNGFKSGDDFKDLENYFISRKQNELNNINEKQNNLNIKNNFMIKNGYEGKDFHNTLVRARIAGFKTNDDFKDLELYLKYKNKLKNEKLEIDKK